MYQVIVYDHGEPCYAEWADCTHAANKRAEQLAIEWPGQVVKVSCGPRTRVKPSGMMRIDAMLATREF